MERWTKQKAAGDRTFEGVKGTRWRDAAGVRRVNAEARTDGEPRRFTGPEPEADRQVQGPLLLHRVPPDGVDLHEPGLLVRLQLLRNLGVLRAAHALLSAKKIVDQMEACDEPFVFVLDDNFLTNKRRVVELCEEMERRGLKKFWMTQGRTDFAADNPELIARLAKNGLVMLLSGFESNDDDNLAALRKKSSWEKNLRANQVLRENGVISTGIFMARPDWTKEQFAQLYEYVNSLDIGIPLFTILTPLPGTQLYRAYKDKLLTNDHRLFDLLHAVLPTRLPRAEFYAEFCRAYDATEKSVRSAYKWFFKARPTFIPKNITSIVWFYARTWRYQRIHGDYRSFLRDEEGLLDGPGAKAGLTWKDVTYPKGDEHAAALPSEASADDGEAASPAGNRGTLVKLRIPRRIWADDVAEASAARAASVG